MSENIKYLVGFLMLYTQKSNILKYKIRLHKKHLSYTFFQLFIININFQSFNLYMKLNFTRFVYYLK